MNFLPKAPHKQIATLVIGGLLALAPAACTTRPAGTQTPSLATVPAAPTPSASIALANEEPPIEFFPSEMFTSSTTLPQRLVGRTRQARDTDLTLDALETIELKPSNGLTEPLSATAEIFGFQGQFSPCETPNGDAPISRFQTIVQSGGPGTTGVGSPDEKTFEIDLFGTVGSRDDDVTIMGTGTRPRSRTKRINIISPGTIFSVWTDAVESGTTIPNLPAGATDVRIDAAIIMAGFNELDANNTKTICVQFINDEGQPMSRTNQVLEQPATTREFTVESELGYIILVTFTTSQGARYLQWSGNIELNNLGQPTAGAIAAFSPTNPIRDGGKELAYDMQRRGTMMLIRYADKMVENNE